MLWMQSRFLMSLCYFMTFSSRVFTRDLMHFLQLETNKNSGWHSTLWFVANDCLNHRPTLRCIDDLNCWAAVFCFPVDSGWDSLREYVSHIPDCHIPHHDSFSQINVEHSNSFYSSELDFFPNSRFNIHWWLMIDDWFNDNSHFQAIMMFIVIGSRQENQGNKTFAYNNYIETQRLIKFVMKLYNSNRNNQDVDIRYEEREMRKVENNNVNNK